ncbi:MAG: DUF6252 family protein [Cryomorphaceae bacterium]|nr:hypothetical protein [Flavobacteriales bacterium]
MKSFAHILFVISSFLIFTSCGGDDDSNNPPSDPGGHGGSASFDISGEIEGEHSGIADFRAFEMAGVYNWDITIINQDPITFNISFLQQGEDPIDRPGEGTYELGINPGNQSNDIYTGSYVNYGGNPSEQDNYTIGIDETSGTMEITSSSDELIEGTFSFTAARIGDDGNVAGTIEVTNGEFSAVPRP